jgi:tetratricopeptide (TPR) repeat protein
MLRPTSATSREGLPSPASVPNARAKFLNPANKKNLLLGMCGLLVGSFIGLSLASARHQSTEAQPSPATQQAQAPGANPTGDQQLIKTSAETIRRAKNEPQNFTAQLQAAEVYYQIEGYEQAIALLEHADQLRPNSDEVVTALANVNFLARHYEEAERWFRAALNKHPDDVNLRTNLGMTFLFRTQPDFERALTEFRRSLEINPQHEPSLQNMIIALARKGERAQAQLFLEKLEKINPRNTALEALRLELDQTRAANAQLAGHD